MLLFLAILQGATAAVVERTGTFASRRVTESSGVAVSRAHPGVLWTHNDSGDDAFLYATDLTGADRGRIRVPGVAPADAEDLAEGLSAMVAKGGLSRSARAREVSTVNRQLKKASLSVIARSMSDEAIP